MKRLLLNTCIAIILMLALACSKSGSVLPAITEVYVSGDSVVGYNRSVVKYWKNGIHVDCSDGTIIGYPSGLAVSGLDVYMAGSLLIYGSLTYPGQYSAMAWKNSTGVKLSTGIYGTRTNTVKVYGNDIYYGGSLSKGNVHSVATYWKNGLPVAASDGTTFSTVHDMAISGSDVYLLLVEDNLDSKKADIWKNGVVTNLFTGKGSHSDDSQFGEMVVNNGDLYVAASIPTYYGAYIAEYFKNGIATKLSDSTNSSNATSICIVGNDVYVAGSFSEKATFGQGPYKATYWKNGKAVYLTNASQNAYATSITVVGKDVYVAGNESNGKNDIAKYWKNGVPVILSNGTTDTYIDKIVVVKH